MLRSLRCLYKPLMDRPNSIIKQLTKYLEQSSTAPCVKENNDVAVNSEEPSIVPEVQTIDLTKEDVKDLPPASEDIQLQEQSIKILEQSMKMQEQSQPQEHIQPQEHMQPQEQTQPPEQIQPQEHIQRQQNIQQQEDINLQEHIELLEQSELQEYDELPEKYQLVNSFQMNIHCQDNTIDKNMAVISQVVEEEEAPWRDPIATRIHLMNCGTGYTINCL